jgi:hypothetical protein
MRRLGRTPGIRAQHTLVAHYKSFVLYTLPMSCLLHFDSSPRDTGLTFARKSPAMISLYLGDAQDKSLAGALAAVDAGLAA